jgi:hypothetical protein
MVVIAGVTPSGYNSLGFGWQIITVPSSTTFTYYNHNTSLASAGAAGTAACPLLRDVDVFTVLNSGSGQTCQLPTAVGVTGQNIYLKNIGAGTWTIAGLSANSETIDGSATVTLAANGILRLQSRIVSSAAAGCN